MPRRKLLVRRDVRRSAMIAPLAITANLLRLPLMAPYRQRRPTCFTNRQPKAAERTMVPRWSRSWRAPERGWSRRNAWAVLPDREPAADVEDERTDGAGGKPAADETEHDHRLDPIERVAGLLRMGPGLGHCPGSNAVQQQLIAARRCAPLP